MKRYGLLVAALFVGAVTVLVCMSQEAQAIPGSQTANTLKVSPVRTDIEVVAGRRKVVQATVTNLANTPVTVTPVANDFIAGDERGTPALILDEKQYAPTHSLKRFMSPLSPVTIGPRASKTISVVITVPSSAQAGGYFGSVRFMPTTPDSGGQVNLSPSVASLILLKVPGAIVEELSVSHFEVRQKDDAHFYFQKPEEISVYTRFKNEGNIQAAPVGRMQLYKGDEIVYEVDFNAKTPSDMVLPDSARRWNIPLKNIDSFGYYKVVATFTYGEKNTTLELNRPFLVAPLWIVLTALALPLLIVVAILVCIGILVRRRRRNGSMGRRRGRSTSKPRHRRFGR